LFCAVDSLVAIRVSVIVEVGALVLYQLLLLEYWLLTLETRPTVGVVELRCLAFSAVLVALGLVFDEVLADFKPTGVGCVLQLTIGTLQLFYRQLDAIGRYFALGCFMLTGTFHAGRCDVTVTVAVAPLLTALVLGWSVALGIVIRAANTVIILRMDAI
jgi:hypothetical protein